MPEEFLIVYYKFTFLALIPMYRIYSRAGLDRRIVATLLIPIAGWIIAITILAVKHWNIDDNLTFEVE